MTRDGFWGLVDRLVVKSRGNLGRFETALHAHLKSLAPEEIEDFAGHYGELLNETDVPSIREAAHIIGCGGSDDGFMDFRRWVVFQGSTAYQQIIHAPDFLGSYDRASDPIEAWCCEFDLGRAYEEVTGRDLQLLDLVVHPNTEAHVDDPTALAKRYPTLWQRVQHKNSAQKEMSDLGRELFLGATLERIKFDGEAASFVFSTGAEIRIRGYWPHYRTRYNLDDGLPCYAEHPMLGQKVASIDTDNFPHSFYMWFENRRKLSLGRDRGDCSDFDVIDARG